MPPLRDQTGVPGVEAFFHFHSSTTWGSAWWMSSRIRFNTGPRQSPSSRIRWSIIREAELGVLAAPFVATLADFLDVFTVIAFAPGATGPAGATGRRSQSLAGQLTGLLHPGVELSFVEPFVLVDVKVAHLLVLGLAGWDRTQRRAAEERYLDVVGEA